MAWLEWPGNEAGNDLGTRLTNCSIILYTNALPDTLSN